MSRITFNGKTYNSEFEMPQDVRQAYQEYQMHRARTTSLTDVVDMPAEVEDVYRRALKREEEQSSSPSTQDLPTTEELYRQSAPANMRHMPSDESVYQHSQPVIDPQHPTIEPDSGLVIRGLLFGIVISLILIGVIFLAVELLRQVP